MPNRLHKQIAAEPTDGCTDAAERRRAGHDLRDERRAIAPANASAFAAPRERDVARVARPVHAIPDALRPAPAPAPPDALPATTRSAGVRATAARGATAAARPPRILAVRDDAR